MFAGERRDPSKGVEGLEIEFPEFPVDKEGSLSNGEAPTLYSSLKENACVAGRGRDARGIFSVGEGVFKGAKVSVKRKKVGIYASHIGQVPDWLDPFLFWW